MIVISTLTDIPKIQNIYVRQHIEKLLKYLLNEYKEYCPNGSISSIGAIYFVEGGSELCNHKAFGLVNPLNESRFEIIEEIGEGFSHGIVVVSNDFAISIFSPTKVLDKHFERMKNHEHH